MAASKRRMLSLEVLETAASGEEERAASGTEALQCWRLDDILLSHALKIVITPTSCCVSMETNTLQAENGRGVGAVRAAHAGGTAQDKLRSSEGTAHIASGGMIKLSFYGRSWIHVVCRVDRSLSG